VTSSGIEAKGQNVLDYQYLDVITEENKPDEIDVKESNDIDVRESNDQTLKNMIHKMKA